MEARSYSDQLRDVASRIKGMREIMALSESEMAEKTEVSLSDYKNYESGSVDLPFSFIHKCALVFSIDITDLLEGESTTLTSYTVTRKGQGVQTAKEEGIDIFNLAPKFKDKLAEPYWVRYEYSEELQSRPIQLSKHSGQEFDLVLSGSLLVQVGENKEILHEGDSIYYNSSTPHGMIAVEGKDCVFCAVVLSGEENKGDEVIIDSIVPRPDKKPLLVEKFVKCSEDKEGHLTGVEFKNTDSFNFGFDVVDAISEHYPNKTALVYLDRNRNERRFTFGEIKKESNRCANYLLSLGVKKGDKVMLVLKRHWEFWISIVALHKIGAVAIPATYLLREHDYIYRFNAASVSAVLCTATGDSASMIDSVLSECPTVKTKIIVQGEREGWHDFDK